jgi:hypothetical protein
MAMPPKQQEEINKAISRMVKYSETQEPWPDLFTAFSREVMAGLEEGLDIGEGQAIPVLEEMGVMDTVFPFMLEEFYINTSNDDNESLIAEFLRRRGWREKPVAKRYLQALNETFLKLWEIVGLKRGVYLDVRPFGTTQKPIRVYEKLGSQNADLWMCLAARLVKLDGRHIFGGAFLPLDSEDAAYIMESCEDISFAVQEAVENKGEPLSAADREVLIEYLMQGRIFSLGLVQFCGAYLPDDEDEPEMPVLTNKDGDALGFCTVRYPVLDGQRAELIRRLESMDTLDSTQADPLRWVWLTEPSKENTFVSSLGNVSLEKPGVLEIEVNSANRADRAQAVFGQLLEGCIGEPLVVHESMDSLLGKASAATQIRTSYVPGGDGLVGLDEAGVVQKMLDQHYRQVLGEPIPMLDDKSPRECAADPNLRGLLVSWLKYLERMHSRSSGQVGMAEYDPSWIWQELGLDRSQYAGTVDNG